MSDLKLFLFGAPGLERDGTTVELETRKATALLAYLAMTGRGHRREALAGLFWPDYDQARAYANLRRTLWAFTKAEVGGLVEADTDTVSLNSAASLWVDAPRFRAQLAERRTHGHPETEVCPQCRQLLAEAASLYRGDFLSGFTLRDSPAFDEWQFFQAESLRRELAGALELLARAAGEQREFETAIAHARRWLALDPLQEPAQRALMRLFAAGGQRNAALRQYQECVRVLDEELGAAPAPETTALFEQIRAGDLGGTKTDERSSPAALSRHNLPTQLSSLVGRERERAEVTRRLQTARLVTLTGSGGSGKTRLALRVAETLVTAYTDGVWLVELTALSDPALILPTMAAVLGVPEVAGRPLLDGLTAYLRDRQALLVIDNCEHLIDASARLVEALLRGAAQLCVLATSREPLGLAGESVYRVPSLSLPPGGRSTLEALAQSEAGRLFAERAAAGQPGFNLTDANAPVVAQICQRLDGIPLALELAAARLRALPLEQIAARLDDRFRLLTGGSRTALPRQQTLRALIDWSWDLLTEPERLLLSRLSVFVDGWSLEAAEAIGAGGGLPATEVLDLLTHLVDKSLVTAEEQDGQARYRMLETMRQYTRDKLLEAGQSEQVRDRHLEFFVQMAEAAAPRLHGPEGAAWFNRLDVEHGNLRAALDWSLGHGKADAGLRLSSALGQFWVVRGHWTEGRAWLTQILAQPENAALNVKRARALNGAAFLAYSWPDLEAAGGLYQEALSIWRGTGPSPEHATALRILGNVVTRRGDATAGWAQLEESLAMSRALNDQEGIAWTLLDMGVNSIDRGKSAAARLLFEESLALHRQLGNQSGIAYLLQTLGWLALHEGDLKSAQPLLEESLTLHGRLGNRHGVTDMLRDLGQLAVKQGDYAAAQRRLDEERRIWHDLGQQRPDIADTQLRQGMLHVARGDLTMAEEWIAAGRRLAKETGATRLVAYSEYAWALVRYYQGQPAVARALLEASLTFYRRPEAWWILPLALSLLGWITARSGEPATGLEMLRESLKLLRARRRQVEGLACLEWLAGVAVLENHSVFAGRLLGAVSTLREALGAPVAPIDQAEHERALANIRAQLDEAAFTQAWSAGRALAAAGWERVAAYALGESATRFNTSTRA